MANIIKRLGILLVLLSIGIVFVNAQSTGESGDSHDTPFYNYIENEKLNSSMFTRADDMRTLDPDTFIEITDQDVLVSDNDRFEMYLNESTLNFKIRNLNTGYVWSTAIDEPDAGGYDGLLGSGIGIEYVNKRQNMAYRGNIGLIDTEFEVDRSQIEDGVSLDISVGGFCATRNCRRLYDDYVDGVYDLDFMIGIGLTELNTSFTLEVVLTDEGIKAHIPYESIVEEETDWTILTSIILFPSLGATVLDETPGYMVIPDGIGTLIRYEDKQGQFLTPFEERFYGANSGLRSFRRSVTNYPLSMPIFGAVHGVNQNGFTGIIESGDVNARLMAYPNGAANIDYNLIFSKFDLRQTYRQSFTSDGAGGATRVADTLESDITLRYNFLEGDDANYVGVGRNYRDHLLANDVLTPQEVTKEDIPVHMQYLMSDSLNRFIGTSLIEMSTVEGVRSMYQTFMDHGVTHQRVSLMGWNKGGYSGHLPSRLNFENALGSNREYRELIELINQENRVLLLNNYIDATNATSNISSRNDVAQGVDRFQLESQCSSCVYTKRYMLYPSTSRRLSFSHFDDFVEADVDILFERVGSTLFSYHDSIPFKREHALGYYRDIMEQYTGNGAYMYPNAYAYEYTQDFYHAPLFNSQLNYYDDLVPLIPVVLNGHMEIFSQFLNYNSLGREQLLMLVDFGMNPAYILSEERSSNLRGSDIERYFSTNFANWENTIVEQYDFINDALKHVRGETIERRDVLQSGVVEVTYSNNVRIVINYTSQEVLHDATLIEPYDYMVRGVE